MAQKVKAGTSQQPDFIPADSTPDFIPAEAPQAPAATPTPSLLQRIATQPSQFSHANPLRYLDEIGQGMGQGVEAIAHPIDTIANTYKFLTTNHGHDPSGDKPLLQGLGDVADTVAQGAGQMATGAIAGRALGELPRVATPVRIATGKALSTAADVVDPDITGVVSPRLAHAQKFAGRLGNVLQKPPAPEPPALEAAPSPAAQQLQNRIAIERDLRAQQPFPRISEGLPEVEEAQPQATDFLHREIEGLAARSNPGAPYPATPSPELLKSASLASGPRIAPPPPSASLGMIPVKTPAPLPIEEPALGPTRTLPGQVGAERIYGPYKSGEGSPINRPPAIPSRPGLLLKPAGKVTDIRPSAVGNLLENATGGKPLIANVPLRQQLDRVTPVTPKESSVVESHSYDPSAQELTVKTKNGGEYVHGDVSPEQAKAFANAESKGKAWNDIRNNSTLVAKVVNGKRVAIKPVAPRVASPNDLTPVLEESLRQAKAKR